MPIFRVAELSIDPFERFFKVATKEVSCRFAAFYPSLAII
jgi:hypothetical protein